MQGDSRGRVPLLFLAYDDFFRSAKLNEKYDCQNPSGKRVYANMWALSLMAREEPLSFIMLGAGVSPYSLGLQKRSSLITVGTSHGFALSFAFLSTASHRWRVHSSARMVSATLNLPCVGHSRPVAWPV